MTLAPGVRLGPYEVTARIGAGGMGEIYRATDTNLKRQVAIKVLPASLASDPGRLARFRREAELLAALNHPGIAAIYGLETADGTLALVMELVEGPTLADRIARGPLPIDEVVPIAKQITEAVEAAHEQGIIHRDLKPANIKVRDDGTVKVLDFGLAKAFDPVYEVPSPDLTASPTMTSPAMTRAGVILGTAAYMAPEQAQGRKVDKRADIWAFGCILFEMLTGQAAFDGESVAEILGAVLKSEPDWSRLPVATPSPVQRLLRRALKKDVHHRLSDIRDARIEIEDGSTEAVDPSVSIATPTPRVGLTALTASIAIAATLIVVLAIPALRHVREQTASEIRVEIVTPSTAAPLDFALSPDGRSIAFVASGDGPQRLWLRSLTTAEARVLVGTEGASFPFWSPNSRSIGFFAGGKLYRVDVAGGPPQAIANAAVGRGGAWNAEGTIVFAPTAFGPLLKISVSGGEAVPVTHIDPPLQTGHHFPQFLPDGRQFLYYTQGASEASGIYLSSLDGAVSTFLTAADSGTFLPPGSLIFGRQSVLFAQRLDVKRRELTGEPRRLADPVGSDGVAAGHGGFSVSAAGPIAYRAVDAAVRQLTWFDRSDKAIGAAGEPKPSLNYPELSRDGRRVAVQLNVQNHPDIWLMDLARGGLTRFTFGPAINNAPVWSPDGTRIAFSSNRTGLNNLYVKPSSQTGTEQLLLETATIKYPRDWSPDGGFLLYSSDEPKSGRDLLALPISGSDRKPIPVATTPFVEDNGQFSPDGRWVAYETNESGNRVEVVVQPFPQPTGKWQVSNNGGVQPRWSSDGKELYFIAPDGKLMAVPVATSGTNFTAGTPVALFPARIAPGAGANKQQYAVSRDGRFLINQPVEATAASPITLILNWNPNLKE